MASGFSLLSSREFLSSVFKIALPIGLLALLQSSASVIDQLMVGSLGEVAIAGIGIGSKPVGIVITTVYAIAAGLSIFVAQYFGQHPNKKYVGYFSAALLSAFILASLFAIVCWAFPSFLLTIFTDDETVIQQGSRYLSIVTVSYFPLIIVALYTSVLRATNHVNIAAATGFVAMASNTFLNWVLIFGHLGAPELGATGAAIATVASRFLEMILLLILSRKRLQSLPTRAVLNLSYYRPLFKVTLPILFTYLTFTMADTLYSAIYGNLSTRDFVAVTLAFPIQGFLLAFFGGISAASGILVGQKIGAGSSTVALHWARGFTWLGFLLPAVLALLSLPLLPYYLSFYEVSDVAKELSFQVLFVMAIFLPIKVINMVLMSGILPSGGETKSLFYINLVGQWCIGIPLGVLAAFVWKLSLPWVFALVTVEELARCVYCLNKMNKQRWLVQLS